MSHFAIAAPLEANVQRPALQWAHDIRNVLSTISLHLNTLELLSGQHGVRSADSIHALIGRVTGDLRRRGATARIAARRAEAAR